MKKIVAFGASNSSKSINKALATWTAKQSGFDFEILDLNDYEMPIFSVDREASDGHPKEAFAFKEKLQSADGIVISFAEYNGAYTSAFKNVFDWFSRISNPRWLDKPMFLMSTSPGRRGGQSSLDQALKTFPHQGGKVLGSFSLPSFNDHFSPDLGITEKSLLEQFNSELEMFVIGVKGSNS